MTIDEILEVFENLVDHPNDLRIYKHTSEVIAFEVYYYEQGVIDFVGELQDMGIFAESHRLGDTDDEGMDIWVEI